MNEMKEIMVGKCEKEKVTEVEIVVHGTREKPYYEIKYKNVGSDKYNIGYSSYDLNNCFIWLEECFEMVESE